MNTAHEAEPTIADLILDASGVAEARWSEALNDSLRTPGVDFRLFELSQLVETLNAAYQLAVAIDAPTCAEVAR